MSRVLHAIEKGLRIFAENSQTSSVDIIFGSALPGNDSGEQDAAAIGSMYLRTTGLAYVKIANAGATADWKVLGDVNIDDLTWREELFRAATVDTLSAGTTDPTTWTDNESGLAAGGFSVDDIIVGDSDGTPALFKVTAIAAPNLTIAAHTPALADNDKMIVRHYLPDSGATQENAALLIYGGGAMIKVADVDWEFATGIKLSSGYTAGNGSISSADSVESAIQKLDGNQQDIQTLTGVAQGSTVLGAFASPASLLMAATYTVKSALQRLGDLMAQLRGVTVAAITTAAAVDSVPVASVKCCKWLVEVFEDATPANRQAFEVFALNDGATNVDDTVYAKLKIGSNFNLTLSVDINASNMRLMAASTSAGVTAIARRIEVVKSVL